MRGPFLFSDRIAMYIHMMGRVPKPEMTRVPEGMLGRQKKYKEEIIGPGGFLLCAQPSLAITVTTSPPEENEVAQSIDPL